MPILTDENISPAIVTALEAAGHDVVAVTTAMCGAGDRAVVDRANAEGRILVTEDKDFGELAFKHEHRPAAIIRLALPGASVSLKAVRLCEVIEAMSDQILGHAVVIEPVRVRSRAFTRR